MRVAAVRDNPSACTAHKTDSQGQAPSVSEWAAGSKHNRGMDKDTAGQSKGEKMGRGANKSGWLHTLRN